MRAGSSSAGKGESLWVRAHPNREQTWKQPLPKAVSDLETASTKGCTCRQLRMSEGSESLSQFLSPGDSCVVTVSFVERGSHLAENALAQDHPPYHATGPRVAVLDEGLQSQAAFLF